MRIMTKKGDEGITSLYWGDNVSKDHLRIEANGTIDEVSSFLGLAKSSLKSAAVKKVLETIQRDLFIAATEIATTPKVTDKLTEIIDEGFIRRIEEEIKQLETRHINQESYFAIPGDNVISSYFDIARTIARRAERRIVTLYNKGALKNQHILIYLNRISDLLYLLARSFEKKSHRKKIKRRKKGLKKKLGKNK